VAFQSIKTSASRWISTDTHQAGIAPTAAVVTVTARSTPPGGANGWLGQTGKIKYSLFFAIFYLKKKH